MLNMEKKAATLNKWELITSSRWALALTRLGPTNMGVENVTKGGRNGWQKSRGYSRPNNSGSGQGGFSSMANKFGGMMGGIAALGEMSRIGALLANNNGHGADNS
eukprot:438526-Karenia_brevis.AAC.1